MSDRKWRDPFDMTDRQRMRADELGHDALTGPMETYPWDWETVGDGGIVVYSKAAGFREFGEIPDGDEARNGWPFGDEQGRLKVKRIMWDDPTATIVVVVE